MFYFRCYQHEHIAQKRITLFHCLGFFGQRINIYLLLEELMLAEAGVGKVAGQLEELMLAEAGVGKVAGQLEELMLAEAGVGKVAGQLEEQMLAEAGVGEVATLLVWNCWWILVIKNCVTKGKIYLFA